MKEITLEDIQGYEYDWLACDINGHVALLSTGGNGYAPRAFINAIDVYDKAIEHMLNLSETTTCDIYPKIAEGCVNTWKEASKRGVYGYDTNYEDEGYSLVSKPKKPIVVDQLPFEIAVVIKQVCLGSVSFQDKLKISKAEITENDNNW